MYGLYRKLNSQTPKPPDNNAMNRSRENLAWYDLRGLAFANYIRYDLLAGRASRLNYRGRYVAKSNVLRPNH